MPVARQDTTQRRALIAKLHIAKKQLGLDEALYRDALEAATTKRSAAAMTEPELLAALKHFEARGFKPVARPCSPLSPRAGRGEGGEGPSPQGPGAATHSPYLPKVRALWISGWHLGVVRDRSDDAMAAFVKRQTGLDAARWLTRAEDAAKVIEALKSWLTREAGVAWPPDAHADRARKAVVWAQFERLVALDAFRAFSGTLTAADIEAYGWRVTGKAAFRFYEAADWNRLIAAAGAKLRGALARASHPSPSGGGACPGPDPGAGGGGPP